MSEPTLFARLCGSELLTTEQLAELRPLPEASNPDPKILARVVLQRGWLTRFQISLVAAGKGKDLSVGSYVLLDKLGEGGMGQVFKARHKHMNRLVARSNSCARRNSPAPTASGGFYQEIKAAAQLVHPNIVMAFDAGQSGNTHFFSMEFIDGTDLAKIVREKGRLPDAQSL